MAKTKKGTVKRTVTTRSKTAKNQLASARLTRGIGRTSTTCTVKAMSSEMSTRSISAQSTRGTGRTATTLSADTQKHKSRTTRGITTATKRKSAGAVIPPRAKRQRVVNALENEELEDAGEGTDEDGDDTTPLTKADIPKIVEAVRLGRNLSVADSDYTDNPHLGEYLYFEVF